MAFKVDVRGEEELWPPLEMQNAVGDRFKETGREYLEYLVQLAGLRPGERVLDVGCGCGRIAIPLSRYLDASGSYEGFDIVPEPVRWCQESISARYPNFQFRVADIYNAAYNPNGHFQSTEFCFPYEDQSFDLIFLTSVFTHMVPREVEHYLREIARTLREGGRCVATFFVLNHEAVRLIEAGKSALDFRHEREQYRVVDPDLPEAAIAYDESYIREACAAGGLSLVEPIWYGSWCGRSIYLNGQDILLLRKQSARESAPGAISSDLTRSGSLSAAFGAGYRPELQLAMLKTQLADARQERPKVAAQIGELRDQLHHAEDRIRELEDRLTARDAELKNLRSLLAAIERGRVLRLLNAIQRLRHKVERIR